QNRSSSESLARMRSHRVTCRDRFFTRYSVPHLPHLSRRVRLGLWLLPISEHLPRTSLTADPFAPPVLRLDECAHVCLIRSDVSDRLAVCLNPAHRILPFGLGCSSTRELRERGQDRVSDCP